MDRKQPLDITNYNFQAISQHFGVGTAAAAIAVAAGCRVCEKKKAFLHSLELFSCTGCVFAPFLPRVSTCTGAGVRARAPQTAPWYFAGMNNGCVSLAVYTISLPFPQTDHRLRLSGTETDTGSETKRKWHRARATS